MPENNELVDMLRAIIHEELKPVNEKLGAMDDRLTALEAGQHALEAGQHALEAGQHALEAGQHALETGQQRINDRLTTIEATVEDIRVTNRRTHKEIFTRLDYMWEDIKRLSSKEEKAVR